MPLHRRLPKRGFKSLTRDDVAEVRLSDLQGMKATRHRPRRAARRSASCRARRSRAKVILVGQADAQGHAEGREGDQGRARRDRGGRRQLRSQPSGKPAPQKKLAAKTRSAKRVEALIGDGIFPASGKAARYGDLKRRAAVSARRRCSCSASARTSRCRASTRTCSPSCSRASRAASSACSTCSPGGALSRFTIFALGIMPYISASIIMQLMTAVSPQLEQLRKEGETGRRKITQYTRYGTVFLALFQATGISIALESQASLVLEPGLMFRITTVTTLVTGTMFLMWLGEQITERGLGNGISIIIFAGIAAGPAERDRRHARAGAHRRDASAHRAC